MASIELSCKEMVELITEYLEDSLSPADRARFEAHLAGCADCTRYLEQFRQTIWLTGTLAEEHLSSDARNELLRAFRGWKQSHS